MFSSVFHSHKMRLLDLSGPFTDQNDKFPSEELQPNMFLDERLDICSRALLNNL